MSPDKKPTKPVDIYVRVSRVNDRAGDSFISPEVQEERCRAQLAARGFEAGEVFIDLDQSGGKMSRPAFDKLMQRVRDKESGGVIVYKLSRFSRRVKDTLAGVEEIESHNAAFLCIEPPVDTSTKEGRFVLTLFSALNEMELEALTEGWKVAQASSIERGIPVGVAPTGYEYVYKTEADGTPVTDKYGKAIKEGLRKVEADSEKIARAYAVRASGGSWSEVARALEGLVTRGEYTEKATGEKRVRTNDGRWKGTAARKLLSNTIYKGVLKNGHEHYFEHLVVVTGDTWAKANERRAEPGKRHRTGKALLAGLLKCSGCGRALTSSTTTKGDKAYTYYICQSGRQLCSAPTRLKAELVEPWVVNRALSYLAEAPIPVGEPLDPARVATLEQDVETATERCRSAVFALSADDPMLAELRTAREDAERALSEYKQTAGVKLYGPDATEWVFERLETEGQRAFLRAVIEKVTVARDAARVPSEFLGETVTGIDVSCRENPWADLARVAVTVKEEES